MGIESFSKMDIIKKKYLHCRKSDISDDRIAFGFFLWTQNRGINLHKIHGMCPDSQLFEISSIGTVIFMSLVYHNVLFKIALGGSKMKVSDFNIFSSIVYDESDTFYGIKKF